MEKIKETPVQPQKAVLVTGASSGLGLETAVYLAERGLRVFATMRDLARRQTLDAAAEQRQVHLDVLPLDVTDRASIDAAIQQVVQEAGGVYGLVNNAGTQIRGYFEDLSDAEIRHVFETNVFGTMAVTRAVLPHMRAIRQGRIVILSSVAGRLGAVALSAYAASKFALEGWGEALALEMGPLGIQVSLIEPGIVQTNIWETNRHTAARAGDPASPYFALFQATEQLADRMVRSATIRSSDVAQVVYQALTARRPRLRYPVGRRTAFLLALQRYLPEAMFERLYFYAVQRSLQSVAVASEKR